MVDMTTGSAYGSGSATEATGHQHLGHREEDPRLGLSADRRAARGKAARGPTPLEANAEFRRTADVDVVGLLLGRAQSRVPELIPIRHGRMLVSPFTFYRGAALVMAADLAGTPTSGLATQLLDGRAGHHRPRASGRACRRWTTLMRATSDIFLGLLRAVRTDGNEEDYYDRQLRDWKVSAERDHATLAAAVESEPARSSATCKPGVVQHVPTRRNEADR